MLLNAVARTDQAYDWVLRGRQVSLIKPDNYDWESTRSIHMIEGDEAAGITESGVDSPAGIEVARKVRACRACKYCAVPPELHAQPWRAHTSHAC